MKTQEESLHVKLSTAHDPKCSTVKLDKLAHDKEPLVRLEVAKNKSTLETTLSHLIRDDDSRVRRAVASRADLPFEMLATLSLDEDSQVALCAIKTFVATGRPMSELYARMAVLDRRHEW